MTVRVLVAAPKDILSVDPASGDVARRALSAAEPGVARFGDAALTGLAADPLVPGRVWCCTKGAGVFRSDDAGSTWSPAGLAGERLMVVAPSPARRDLLWAGVEMSAVWRSDDAGAGWQRSADLEGLASSDTWAFPPRPDTHHVRWVLCHPTDADRLWVAVEAGALVSTRDGGRSWNDRAADGPYDTHEAALHPDAPDVLRIAAGDGYYESFDGGATWSSPMDGLEVGYLRSVAVDPGDPDVVLVTAATHAHAAYAAGHSDGRVYRREGEGKWQRVAHWPDPARTIAPLLTSGLRPGELWAADEHGVHRSGDGGGGWDLVARFDPRPSHVRGLAVTGDTGTARG